MNKDIDKIQIEEDEAKIYAVYTNEKNNFVSNAFKILLLKKDFYVFLNEYRSKLNGTKITKQSKMVLEEFLSKLEKSNYFINLDTRTKDRYLFTYKNLFKFYYPNIVWGKKRDVFIYDPMLNYPKIYYSVFYKDLFDKLFPKKLYTDDIPPITNYEDDRERILQITCDEDIEKTELINYINEYWDEIRLFLNRKNNEKKVRDKSSKHFLRDIVIFNKYQELSHLPILERQINVTNQFRKKVGGIITEENVRKIIANISKLRKQINSENKE